MASSTTIADDYPISESKSTLNVWTTVSRRRHRRHPTPRSPPPLPISDTLPTPWTPTDSTVDPDRQHKLLTRMKSIVKFIQSSNFYSQFLVQLRRHPSLTEKFFSESSSTEFQIVAYGVGSIESYESPRLQVALALLLKNELGASALQVFDPVVSAIECSVLKELGFVVLDIDEKCRREVKVPTLFFMPHCEAVMYEAVIEANRLPEKLNKAVVILGNSFAEYQKKAEEKCSNKSIAVEKVAPMLVKLSGKYVKEIEVVEGGVVEDYEGMDRFYRAFHDISWHLFELDSDTDLSSL